MYDGFLQKELAETSDLHLKKGFLKKFGVSCKCGKDVNINAVENEFGLVRLTKVGNKYILNNKEKEDSYVYKKQDGTSSTKKGNKY